MNQWIGISGTLVHAVYKSSVLHFMAERTVDLVISPACSELIPFFALSRRSKRTLNSLKVTCPTDTQFSIWHNGELEPEMENYLLYLKQCKLTASIKDIGWGKAHDYHLSRFYLGNYHYILLTDNDMNINQAGLKK